MNLTAFDAYSFGALTPLLLWAITTFYFINLRGKNEADRWLVLFMLLVTATIASFVILPWLQVTEPHLLRYFYVSPLLLPMMAGSWIQFAYSYPLPLAVKGAEKRAVRSASLFLIAAGVPVYIAGLLTTSFLSFWYNLFVAAWFLGHLWANIVFWRQSVVLHPDPAQTYLHRTTSRALAILSIIPLLGSVLNFSPFLQNYLLPLGYFLGLIFLMGLVLIRLSDTHQRQLFTLRELTLQQALQQSERRFFKVFDTTPVAMAIIHAVDGRFQAINSAFSATTGFSRADVLDKPLDELGILIDVSRFYETWNDNIRHGAFRDREIRFRHKSGAVGIGILSGETLELDGQPSFIAAIHDITERKQSEEFLARHAQEFTNLYLTAIELAEAANVNAILPIIVSRAAGLFNMQMGQLYLGHPDSQNLQVVAVHNQPESLLESTISLSDSAIPAKIARSGQSVMLTDPQMLAGCEIPFTTTAFKRLMGAPLRQKDQVSGILILFDEEGTPLPDDNAQLLELFAAYSALALERAYVFEREQRRVAQLAALNRVSRDLTVLQNLDVLLQQITERAIHLLGRPAGGVSLYRPERNELEWVVETGDTIAPIGLTTQFGEGMTGQVWATGEAVIVNDYKTWDSKSLQRTDLAGSVMGVPIQWGDNFLGVLAVVDASQRPFTPDDADLLSQFAIQAAIAIENSRLYLQAQVEIFERTRAESALRKSEDRYRTIVDSISDALFIFQIETGEMVDMNQRACELYGYSRDELLKIPASKLDDAGREYTQESLASLFRQRALTGPHTFEWKTKTKSGHTFWAEASVRIARIGNQDQFLVTVRDISDRKKAEDALREYSERLEEMVSVRTAELTAQTRQLALQAEALAQAKEAAEDAREDAEQQREKAEIANQAKSIFLANMSHELRTPLNGILGYAQILAQNENLTRQQKEGLAIIRDSGQHLLTLINDILDLSKIEASRMELYPTAVSLPQFLGEIAGITRMRAQQKKIEFHYRPAPDLPPSIRVDDKRLRQVLINLLDNGIKFTDAGSVTFSAQTLTRCTSADAGVTKLRFAIADTGIGIPASDIESIFKPFTQAGDVRRRAEGTGLGLTITRKLLQAMGSDLRVESTVDAGSTFWFDLEVPCVSDAPAHVSGMKQIVGYEGPQRTILVIDDNRVNGEVLTFMLEKAGFTTLYVESGAAGVTAAAEHRPDAVFIDLVMPDMDGFETARALRRVPELQDTVLIAVSASAFFQDAEKSREAGCNDFLAKPVQGQELFAVLGNWLQLVWRYADKPVSQAPTGPLIPPPAAKRELLLDLALRGDLRSIQREVESWRIDGEHAAFAQKLLALARNYDERGVLALIQEHMSP